MVLFFLTLLWPLHIQISALRMALNKALPRTHFIAHKHVEDFIGLHGLLNVHTQDSALAWIHGGIPQRLRIHLAKTFVTTNLWLLAIVCGTVLGDNNITLFISIDEACLLTYFDVEQGRLRDVQMAFGDQLGHMTEEE